MTAHRPPDVTRVSLAVVIAAAAAGLTALALSAAAGPSGLKTRIAAIEERAERLRGAPIASALTAYPRAALCRGDLDGASDRLRVRVAAAASGAGLRAPDISAAPASEEASGAQLRPILLQVRAQGPYDAAMALLSRLADGQPEIFADTLDIKSEGAAVSIAFTGRILCSTSDL